jgi:hypothetical protein
MSFFSLSLGQIDGKRIINFANNSQKFVEVIFTIDDKEVKEGKALGPIIKGYAYPPKLEKPVRITKNGQVLPFNPRGGMVKAYVFSGDGQYKPEDIDKPAFLRHKLVDKVKFKRTSDQPIEVLQIRY